jgi:5-methylcytosine-specific restriction protein A
MHARTLSRPKPRLAAAPSRIRPPAKVGDPFYDSQEWRILVARLIAVRGRRCEKCGRTRDAEGRSIRVYADHITELRDGGSLLDPAGIQLLCALCHGSKTQAERVKRMGTRYVRQGK